MKIFENFPAIYTRILPSFFEQTIQKETLATCHDCAMCPKSSQETVEDVGYFSPNLKCCTYHPKLPNYLIGGILSDSGDKSEEGNIRIRQRIKAGLGVSPYGLIPTRKHTLFYNNNNKAFGRSNSLICPFYSQKEGICSIWNYRDAVCSTYFCKSVRGVDGKSFWDGIKHYLNHVQDSLAWYTLKELNFNLNDLLKAIQKSENPTLEVNDLDEHPPSKDEYQQLWQDWVGKEEELYISAFSIVKKLTKSDLDRIIGSFGQVIFEACKKRYEEMLSPRLPKVLKRNPTLAIYRLNDEKSLISCPSGLFEIKSELCDALLYFDGRKKNSQVARLLKNDYGVSLSPELLISLYQNRILLPSENKELVFKPRS